MNLVGLMSVLFIFSELMLCRINTEKFIVANLAFCRPTVKY